MKKIFFICIMLLSTVMTISAQQDIKEDYLGKFTRIYMNGEKSVPDNSVITNVLHPNSLISLHIDPFQLGKMPGSIELDATNIKINPDGSFNQTVYNAIKLTILRKVSNFNAVVTGNIKNNVLTYKIESLNAFYLGFSFTAIVEFQGVKINKEK